MSFQSIGPNPYTSSYSPQLSFDLEGMMQKAKLYAKNDENLLNYISKILNDEKFQSNPKGYLEAWRERRGYTEEFRMPEDQARMFFDKHFKF